MLIDLKEGLANLDQVRGLRNALWLLLIFGIALLVFESASQYFSTSSLQGRTELLVTLSEVDSGAAHQKEIRELQGELIEETSRIFVNANNPGSYLLERLLRFIKGAYLSLPLFYFIFKLFVHLLKHLKKDTYQFAILFSSMAISATAWLATILGAISVIWNTSDSIFVSWLMFPVVSFLVFFPFALWLALLRIVMPNSKRADIKENADKQEV